MGGDVVDCLFFKQKTAYDMRISDWSSDVCSSDLITSPWKWRHLKSVIVPSVQSPPSMLKLHDFCNRAFVPMAFFPGSTGGIYRQFSVTLIVSIGRSEEHTSELQPLMRSSYAVLCLKKTNTQDDEQSYFVQAHMSS